MTHTCNIMLPCMCALICGLVFLTGVMKDETHPFISHHVLAGLGISENRRVVKQKCVTEHQLTEKEQKSFEYLTSV